VRRPIERVLCVVVHVVLVATALSTTAVPSSAQGTNVPTVSLEQYVRSGDPPVYPADAAKAHVRGMVVLDVIVGADGVIRDLFKISGEESLADSAASAVKTWKFEFPSTPEGPAEAAGALVFRFDDAEDAAHGQLVWSDAWFARHTAEPCGENRPSGTAGGEPGGPSGGAPAAEARPAPEPKATKLGNTVSTGKSVFRPQPVYPKLAKTSGVMGDVVIQVVVDELGMVTCARAVSGHPLLRDAAVQAGLRWVFTPTRLGESPVKVVGTVTFHFDNGQPHPGKL
jgi:TonB family protein